MPIEEILLAALSRTIAATVGDGDVAVDLGGRGPIGAQARCRPAPDGRLVHHRLSRRAHLREGSRRSAKQLLDDVHDTLNAVPHYGIGYGLLRYLYAPTARLLGAARPADIFFSYIGTIPDLPSLSSDGAPVQFDADTAMSVREAIPGLGHAVELRVYRCDWCAAPGLVVRPPQDRVGRGGVARRRVLPRADGADPGGDRGR